MSGGIPMNAHKLKIALKIASAILAIYSAHDIHTLAFGVGCIDLLDALIDLEGLTRGG
jgi:hypothetical protein